MKQKFKIGDRVRGLNNVLGKNTMGELGTIVDFDSTNIAKVYWDNHINGHSCSGKCPNGHGWNVLFTDIELVKNECIVIYRKGNEVIANNKATGEHATSKCHPNDKFDFAVGAKIALDRLVNPKPKLYNGKVVCVETINVYLTIGKIYEFKDGISKYDDGDKFPRRREPIDSLETLNSFGIAKFIEVVE